MIVDEENRIRSSTSFPPLRGEVIESLSTSFKRGGGVGANVASDPSLSTQYLYIHYENTSEQILSFEDDRTIISDLYVAESTF